MLPKQHGLPPQCFISAEAVEWCVHHIKGITTVRSAIALLQVTVVNNSKNDSLALISHHIRKSILGLSGL